MEEEYARQICVKFGYDFNTVRKSREVIYLPTGRLQFTGKWNFVSNRKIRMEIQGQKFGHQPFKNLSITV